MDRLIDDTVIRQPKALLKPYSKWLLDMCLQEKICQRNRLTVALMVQDILKLSICVAQEHSNRLP